MVKKNEIPIEMREALAKKIEELRVARELGINQLILRSNINAKTFYSILNSENKKINPYNLIHLSSPLKIDYKELYRIVGYLSEDDFKESEELKLELNKLKKECDELRGIIDDLKKNSFSNIVNHGIQSLGHFASIEINGVKENGKTLEDDFDISTLSPERLEELKRFIKYLKS